MFESQTTSDPIPAPGVAGQWIQVRALTGRECDAAREAHASGVSSGGARLWATKFRRMLEGSVTDKAQIDQAIADPLTGYDRFVVAASGLVAWSASVPLVATLDAKLTEKQQRDAHYAVRLAAVEGLLDEEVDFIATEVLRRTKPALFQTVEEQQAEKKSA
jgi:hypothetical protein